MYPLRSLFFLLLRIYALLSLCSLCAVAIAQSMNNENEESHRHSHDEEDLEEKESVFMEQRGVTSKLFEIDQRIMLITQQKRETEERLEKLTQQRTRYESEMKTLSEDLKSDRMKLVRLLTLKERVKATRLVELLLSADGPLDQKRREVYIQALFQSGSQRFNSLLIAKNELKKRQRAIVNLSKKEGALRDLLEEQSLVLSGERKAEWEMISAQKGSANQRQEEIDDLDGDRRARATWESAARLAPTQGRWIDEFRKFRGIELAKMYGGGIWILSSIGAPVYAVEEGEVIFADEVKGWGSLVLIQHRYGYLSVYGNLSDTSIKQGDEVKMQTQIGSIGSEMSREGLYFELRRGGETIHPSRWISDHDSKRRR